MDEHVIRSDRASGIDCRRYESRDIFDVDQKKVESLKFGHWHLFSFSIIFVFILFVVAYTHKSALQSNRDIHEAAIAQTTTHEKKRETKKMKCIQ